MRILIAVTAWGVVGCLSSPRAPKSDRWGDLYAVSVEAITQVSYSARGRTTVIVRGANNALDAVSVRDKGGRVLESCSTVAAAHRAVAAVSHVREVRALSAREINNSKKEAGDAVGRLIVRDTSESAGVEALSWDVIPAAGISRVVVIDGTNAWETDLPMDVINFFQRGCRR